MILVFFISTEIFSQKVPDWFQQNMKQTVGTWVTTNKEYQNENEPMESYGMNWKWGIGKQSIVGELYGFINNKKVGPFWEFRQYWDFNKNQGVLVQYAPNGTVGLGPLKVLENDMVEITQVFTTSNGGQSKHGHRSTLNGNEFISSSFLIDASGKWSKNRSYTWHKHNIAQSFNELGEFSISLAVKNIKASMEFYEKLGFSISDVDVNQKWLIMKNGTAKIGIFQGMFPTNTITFNPLNARKIYRTRVKNKIDTQMTLGLEKKSGKASFMIADPDGNPILIDQHK